MIAVGPRLAIVLLVALLPALAGGVVLPGGGPKRTDCITVLMSNGVGYPGGASVARGSTCADGDVCDGDGQRNGVCLFTPIVCVNASDPALTGCSPAQVSAIAFKGKRGKSPLDVSGFAAAAASLGLPTGAVPCSGPVELAVAVSGPDKAGRLARGTAEVRAKTRSTKGADKDRYGFVCRPSTDGPPGTASTSSTTSTTTTSTVAGPTTTTLVLGPAITAAAIDAAGTVTVTFTLAYGTDAGVPVTPRTQATSRPDQARVRFTIARLEVSTATVEGISTTFTRYVNYITGSPETGSQPTYDTTGSFVLLDAAMGTWRYTFGRMLPADLPRDLTHTVGAQIERTVDGERLVANPIYDFVPDGGATIAREVSTTAQCNACHNPLAEHGGGRREVRLCQLCHTDQAVDPQTGNQIDLKHMIHRIHMGKDLPSVANGAVGAKYAIVGFNDTELVFAEKVKTCATGRFETVPCATDADCDGGACTGTGVAGVAFPQDIRNCSKCHAQGATAESHKSRPSALACTGCHDDVNPGETPLNGLAPGTGHPSAGPQPDTLCRVCHKAVQDAEFDITVPGAHTIPLRSTTLQGLQGEILTAAGIAGGPVTISFRLRDGAGTPITSLATFNRVALAISGPSSDFSTPPSTPIVAGNGATGMLSGPDGTGIFTYTTPDNLPADATGTWRVGLEARRNVTVDGQTVSEAVPNPVADWSVDGSPREARRTVVSNENCAGCHGTFSKDFGIHGNLRNRVEYCVVCHNPNVTDFARRKNAAGADPSNVPIHLKTLLHRIHRGEALERQPFVVYGFGSAPSNYTAHNFGEVLFPGDLRDCQTCHVQGTELLPLPPAALPTVQSIVNGASEQVTGHTGPVTAACTSCHDSAAVAAHAETNTTGSGVEACGVCHGEGAPLAVSVVHRPGP